VKALKIVGILIIAYAGVVILFEALLGIFQPSGQDTLTLVTWDEQAVVPCEGALPCEGAWSWDKESTHFWDEAASAQERVLTRLENDGNLYVAANHWPRRWYRRALANPMVEVLMDGHVHPRRAVPVVGAEHDKLMADHAHGWVFRFLTGFPPRYFLRLAPVPVIRTARRGEATLGKELTMVNEAFQAEPLYLRRQTLIVRDIEKSLRLYRDAIGMEVIYDNIIRRPHRTEDRQQEIRLVFLKATDDFIGVLGLVDYEYDNPSHPAHHKPLRKEGFTPGNSVLLFNTTELDERWPVIKAVEGVEIIRGPTLNEYPSYDGTSTILVNVTLFYDPDGFLVEFNQPLDPIH